jgi:hypothetical protein
VGRVSRARRPFEIDGNARRRGGGPLAADPRDPTLRERAPRPDGAESEYASGMPPEPNFDLSAAGLRADGTDLRISVEVLASKLEESLPGRACVERHGGGLLGRGPKRVRAIRVELCGNEYQLTVAEERVEGFRERQVGGISIKRESLPPDEWVAALTTDLRTESERSAQARTALERLLG